jgi:hypothetical protein
MEHHMENLFNPLAYEEIPHIRPATEAEVMIVNMTDLLTRCGNEMYFVHLHTIRQIRDDVAAVNDYCTRELTLIDDADTKREQAYLSGAVC